MQKPSSSYGTSMLTTLAGSKTPDVFYVQDNYFKQYASLGYLLDITEYYNKSKMRLRYMAVDKGGSENEKNI